MAIAFRDQNTAEGATTNVTITKPAALAENDIMLAAIEQDLGTTGTISAPAGWKLLFPQTNLTVDGADISIFWKRATNSEAANYAFTDNGTAGSGGIIGAIAAYSGVDPSAINVSAKQEDNVGTASPFVVTAPTITPTVPNCMIVWIGVADPVSTNTATFAVPASYSSRLTKEGQAGTVSNHLAIADLLQTSAAATGAQSATWTISGAASVGRAGYHIALSPSANIAWVKA